MYKHNINRFVSSQCGCSELNKISSTQSRLCWRDQALRRFYRRIGLPVRLQDAEIPADRLEEMAAKATANDTFKLGAFLPLGQKDVLAIYELCR